MANYSLVINSKFKPFSYQELLQPALMATQAHQALEDAYGELDTKASIWDNLTEGSTKAKAQYQKFASDLAKEAEQLSKYGLSPASRQAMLNMRGRYSRDILPIEQAYKKREAQALAQQNALMRDPTLLFNRMAAETNLDEYLANPNLDYRVYSGAMLEKQVSDAVSALAKSVRNDPQVQKTLMNKLLPYQYELVRQSGFDPETVRATIMGTEGGSKVLSDIVDNTIAASDINDWTYASDVDKAKILRTARANANRGLWSSVGETKYDKLIDTYGMQSALNTQELAKEKELARYKAGLTNPPIDGNPLYRRIANTTVVKNTQDLRSDLEFLKSIDNGGLNKLSKKRQTIEPGPITSSYILGSTGNRAKASTIPSEYEKALARYRAIARKHGLNVNSWGPNASKTLIGKLNKDIENNVIRASTYQLNMTDQSQVAQILGENSNTMFMDNRGRSGLREILENGKLGNRLDADAAGILFGEGKNFNLSYNPNRGYQLSYMDKDNKFHSVEVDPELLNFGDDNYTLGHQYVQDYINKGDMENAASLIDEMMNGLYYRFNTQGVKQSATGKIE